MPETQSSVEDRIKQIIVEQTGVKPGEVTSKSHLVNDLGLDSLDSVELVMALEEEFNIEIEDEVAEKLVTVQQVVEFVQSKVKA
jgi:acyl carrier protein